MKKASLSFLSRKKVLGKCCLVCDSTCNRTTEVMEAQKCLDTTTMAEYPALLLIQ